VEIIPGAYSRYTMLQSVFHTDRFSEWFSVLLEGWGIPLFALAVVSSLSFITNRRKSKIKLFFSVIPWIILLINFFVIPYNKEVRFSFSGFMLSCASIAIALESIDKNKIKLFIWIIPAVSITNIFLSFIHGDMFYKQLFNHMRFIITQPNAVYESMFLPALLFMLSGLASSFYYYFSAMKTGYRKMLILMFIVFTVCGISSLYLIYPDYQYKYYSNFMAGKSWNYIHQEFHKPLKIAYTGTDLNYGLYGPYIKNTVYHVPVTEWNVEKFHECTIEMKQRDIYSVPDTDRIDFCRRNPDMNKWQERLMDKGTDLLFVSILHPNDLPHIEHDQKGFPIEKSWADSNTSMFMKIYSNPHICIYRLNY